MQGNSIRPRILTQHTHSAGIRFQKPQKHPDSGGLPGAIRAQKPVNFAALHAHGQLIKSLKLSKRLVQPINPDHTIVRHCVYLSRGEIL